MPTCVSLPQDFFLKLRCNMEPTPTYLSWFQHCHWFSPVRRSWSSWLLRGHTKSPNSQISQDYIPPPPYYKYPDLYTGYSHPVFELQFSVAGSFIPVRPIYPGLLPTARDPWTNLPPLQVSELLLAAEMWAEDTSDYRSKQEAPCQHPPAKKRAKSTANIPTPECMSLWAGKNPQHREREEPGQYHHPNLRPWLICSVSQKAAQDRASVIPLLLQREVEPEASFSKSISIV